MLRNTQKISKSVEDTEKIARAFINEISKKDRKNAQVIGLYGDLGVGKTAFTKAIAKHLAVKKKVSSPTFVIIKKYPIGKTYGVRRFKSLFHIDAYRLKNEKELLYLGWEEIIANKEHLIFIEWPERVLKILPKNHHKIDISHTKEGYRNFRIR